MSIEQNWKQFNEQADNDLTSLLQPARLSKLHYQGPLEKIRNKVKISMIIVAVLCCPFITLMIFFPYWLLEIAVGVILLISLGSLYACFRFYNKLNQTISSPRPLLSELKQLYHTILHNRKIELRTGLIIWPLAILTGKMLGHMIGSDEPLDTYLLSRSSIIELIVFLIVLIPAMYFLTRRISDNIYGQHIADLKRKIEELEGL